MRKSAPAKDRSVSDRYVNGTGTARCVWLLVIAAAVLAVYANSCDGPFIADDIPGLTKNPDIRAIDSSLGAINDDRQSPLSGRPLVSLSFAINYAAGELNVWGYHAVNVAIHLVNALVLFALVRIVLTNPRWRKTYGDVAVHIAGATALIWALHPLHTETVNYVVQRTELLVAFFYLSGFACAAIGGDEKRSHAWSILAVPLAVGGVFCKEVIVSLPLMILLYDGVFVAGGFVAAVRKRPMMYAGLFATWIALGVIIAGGPRSASVGFAHDITPWQYLLTQVGVLVLYLRLSLWPASLSVSYADWPIANSLGDTIIPGLFIVVLLGVCVVGLIRRSALGLLGLACFLILAPTSSFVPIATEVVAERRMYLPLAAIVLLIVLATYHLFQKKSLKNDATTRAGFLATAAVVAALMAGRTFARNHDYRDTLSLWSSAVAVRPLNHVAQCGVGHALLDLNRPDDALPPLQRSVELKDDYADGFFHQGRALHGLKRYDEAATSFRRVLELDPHHLDAMYNLGLALQLASRYDESIVVYAKLLREQSDNVRASLNMGVSLAAVGRNTEAIRSLQNALAGDPNLANARYNLAWLFAKVGRIDDAAREYAVHLKRHPDDFQARLEFAGVLEQQGVRVGAIREYRKVLASQPANAAAQQALSRLSP